MTVLKQLGQLFGSAEPLGTEKKKKKDKKEKKEKKEKDWKVKLEEKVNIFMRDNKEHIRNVALVSAAPQTPIRLRSVVYSNSSFVP